MFRPKRDGRINSNRTPSQRDAPPSSQPTRRGQSRDESGQHSPGHTGRSTRRAADHADLIMTTSPPGRPARARPLSRAQLGGAARAGGRDSVGWPHRPVSPGPRRVDIARAGRRVGGSTRLWVPNWSSTICDLGVFVYQHAEQIATSEMKVGMAMSQVTAVDELFGTHRLWRVGLTGLTVLGSC